MKSKTVAAGIRRYMRYKSQFFFFHGKTPKGILGGFACISALLFLDAPPNSPRHTATQLRGIFFAVGSAIRNGSRFLLSKVIVIFIEMVGILWYDKCDSPIRAIRHPFMDL